MYTMKTNSLNFKINAMIATLFVVGLVMAGVSVSFFAKSRNNAKDMAEVGMPLASGTAGLIDMT